MGTGDGQISGSWNQEFHEAYLRLAGNEGWRNMILLPALELVVRNAPRNIDRVDVCLTIHGPKFEVNPGSRTGYVYPKTDRRKFACHNITTEEQAVVLHHMVVIWYLEVLRHMDDLPQESEVLQEEIVWHLSKQKRP